MKKNVIAMVLNQNFPDVRVCQEAQALESSGFEVFIIVSSERKSASPEFKESDFNVIELDLAEPALDKYISKFNFSHPTILKRLKNSSEFRKIENRIAAVHVHDLPWARFGENLAKHVSAPLVIDFHENYPALVEELENSNNNAPLFKRLIKKITLQNYRLKEYEKKCCLNSSNIIVVCEENKNRIVSDYRVKRDKVVVVSNTKNPEKYTNYGPCMSRDRINIFYHGSIQRLRGLRTLAQAFKGLGGLGYNLTIVGFKEGCPEKSYIDDCLGNDDLEYVELINWTSDRKVIEDKMKMADICIIPHEKTDIGMTTIPNKIFEYMCHGKPLIVSDLPPLKNVVSESGCGKFFSSSNVHDLREVILSLHSKSDLNELGKKARIFAEGEFNWRNDAQRLTDLYNSFRV